MSDKKGETAVLEMKRRKSKVNLLCSKALIRQESLVLLIRHY